MPFRSTACVKISSPAPSPPAARAGDIAHVLAELPLRNVRIMSQAGVELPHHLRRGAFLRAKHMGRAMLAAQRIRHIAGDNQIHLPQPWIKRGNIDSLQPL
ncbi:hypothetical protein HMSSN036_32150 [Paenibacillus macerans]|nr:hypothetical protein HMSSN036_32150 [Paenibacillus macerans]